MENTQEPSRALASVSFRRVAIIGVGLMGGSWGLALRRAGFAGIRVGCDRAELLEGALERGVIDQGNDDLRAAARAADLVVLATPVRSILESLPCLREEVSSDALVTDVGSTKALICQRAREVFAAGGPMFLGGHPLAGKERSGLENADASLFSGACYAITPLNANDLSVPRVQCFVSLLTALGACPFVTDEVLHDRAAALLSHLPQLMATALAGLVSEEAANGSLPLALAASGFRDMTRLAESSYVVWRDICATNRENIGRAIDALIQKLGEMKHRLASSELERDFERALDLREKLRRIG